MQVVSTDLLSLHCISHHITVRAVSTCTFGSTFAIRTCAHDATPNANIHAKIKENVRSVYPGTHNF